jgi:glycosyltransferase involved in cell wall biosynthesis
MKIFVCANWGLKFSGLLIDYWRAQGHEVEYRLGYDPALHEASDLCFVDACDNNARVASLERFSGSRLAIRLIDIECWMGQPGGVQWENVDVAIFGATHIQELVQSYVKFPDHVKVVHVPFGVNLAEWTYRNRTHGKEVAFIAHWWPAKNLPLALQVMARLGEPYRLHVLGKPANEKWLRYYVEHAVKELDLEVIFTERVDSVDEWLEDKNYLLMTGQKEAFSYAAAEAAAKGIKPLIHNFWGAKNVWPREWIWDTVDECVIKMHYYYQSRLYRDYIKHNYSLKLMMEKINAACEIK